MICSSHLLRYFCKEGFDLRFCICGCHCEIILRYLLSYVVLWQDLHNYADLNCKIDLEVQRKNIFLLGFMMRWSHLLSLEKVLL